MTRLDLSYPVSLQAHRSEKAQSRSLKEIKNSGIQVQGSLVYKLEHVSEGDTVQMEKGESAVHQHDTRAFTLLNVWLSALISMDLKFADRPAQAIDTIRLMFFIS
jgi:hypothetical protein